MEKVLFDINFNKVRFYYPCKDGTSIDNFVIKLQSHFKEIFTGLNVKHCQCGVASIRQLSYDFSQYNIEWDAKFQPTNALREYVIKLFLDFDKVPFRLCNEKWVSDVDKSLTAGKKTDFDYNIQKADNLLSSFLRNNTYYYKLIVYSGIIPTSSWSHRSYVKIIIRLPTNALDIFSMMSISNLTEFGTNHKKEIKDEFCKIVENRNLDLSKLYDTKKERERIARLAENNVRKSIGLKDVGDSYVNETLLANILKKIFPDTIRQYKPKWLTKYSLDIFIPSLNIAVEYNGQQHYKPVKRFGGEEKLANQIKRDEFVRQKCTEYNVRLIEWHYETKITEQKVYDLFSKYVDFKTYVRQKTLFD